MDSGNEMTSSALESARLQSRWHLTIQSKAHGQRATKDRGRAFPTLTLHRALAMRATFRLHCGIMSSWTIAGTVDRAALVKILGARLERPC